MTSAAEPPQVETEADREVNRSLWTQVNATFTDEDADRAWAQQEITWGLFRTPESEIGVLGDVAGLDVVELGCGTAFFSAWLARAGARPVGVDLTPAPLVTAGRCQERFGLWFPLVEASGTDVPLPDASCDLVVSEYGASVWCEPDAWVGEAGRLLRPRGRLVFLTNSVLVTLCVPPDEGYAGERLMQPQRDVRRVQWPGGGVEYHPGHGEWVRVLRSHGFTVDALHELYAPEGADLPDWYEIVTADWAQQWPAEDLWVATLTS